MLRAITNSDWGSHVVQLHPGADPMRSEAPPDTSNGPLQYETYVNQRTHALQQTIR